MPVPDGQHKLRSVGCHRFTATSGGIEAYVSRVRGPQDSLKAACEAMVHHLKKLLSYPVLIVLIAFGIRVFVLSQMWRSMLTPLKPGLPYGYELGRVAQAIASGHGFSSPLRAVDTGPTAWFTPLYPYLVATIFKIWGIFTDKSRLVIEVMNCAFASLTVIPIYAMARKSFGPGVAVGAAWVWVFLPKAVEFPIVWIWDTTLTALFLALILWATLEVRDAKSSWAWAGYGALWCVGVLINPSILSLLPFLLAWAAWETRKRTTQWGRPIALAILIFVVGLVPWTIRNHVVFGRWVVLRSNLGLELWLGNNPEVADTWSPWRHPNDDPAETEKFQRMGEMAYMAEKQNEAIRFMESHPATALESIFHRFVYNWLDSAESAADTLSTGAPSEMGRLALNFLFSTLALLGALFAYRVRSREAILYAIVLLVYPVVFYLTHSSVRYRFPIDPVMTILAVFGVSHALTALRERMSAQPDAAARASQAPTI